MVNLPSDDPTLPDDDDDVTIVALTLFTQSTGVFDNRQTSCTRLSVCQKLDGPSGKPFLIPLSRSSKQSGMSFLSGME